jgi:L-threonylcarbamoyladenylate synthase
LASAAVEAQPSPGISLRHYAPRAHLMLTQGNPAALLSALREHLAIGSGKTGVLLPTQWPTDPRALAEPWADWKDPNALAATLFAALRALDDRGAETIVCPKPAPGGMADAILDRLQKAAR